MGINGRALYYKVFKQILLNNFSHFLSNNYFVISLVRSGETIYVRVGDYDLTSQLGSRGAQTQRVSTTYIHHNHNGQTLDNGIRHLTFETHFLNL